MAVLAFSAEATAQVGLSSQIGSIALVVQVPEKGSLQQPGPTHGIVSGTIGEGSVRVRLSASNGYRLVVRGTGPEAALVSVRDLNGEYQPLRGNAPVTVARQSSGAGELEQEVSFRSESDGPLAGTTLPVRYDLLVDPVP